MGALKNPPEVSLTEAAHYALNRSMDLILDVATVETGETDWDWALEELRTLRQESATLRAVAVEWREGALC